MSTEVEQASRVQHGIQTNVTSTSSAAPTSSPKILKFAAKSGFVIPKNKLSGSLVPAYRAIKKPGGSDPISEESSKQTQRKTKWGPDMTQDAAVRKGLAAAYQTRVDQITKQLNSGIVDLGIVDIEEDISFASQTLGHESSSHNEKSEVLELERREAIGEILKLNPSYKAPANYKPLFREARVPVPVKDYPGFNFIGLVYGPGSDTQKRLEKETGAKIRVFGTKSDKGKKEVTADESDNQNLYEELYVHVCADTYEKVDAAVALIELLVTPVSVNPAVNPTSATAVSSNSVNAVHTSQGTPIPYVIPPPQVNQGVVQSVTGPALVQPFGQFQSYPGPWFPTSSPLGFVNQQNFTPQIPSSHDQMSSTSLNSNTSSFFGPIPAGFGSVQSPSFVPSRPQPLLQQPYMPHAPTLGYNSHPRNHPMPTLHPTPGQSNISPPPFSGNTPTALRPSQIVGPLVPPYAGPPTFSVRSVNPSGSSTAWSQAPAGPNNPGQMSLPVGPPQRPPMTSQSPSPFSVTSGNMVSPMSTDFQPNTSQPSSLLPTSGPAAAMTPAMLPGVLSNPVMAAAPVSLSMPSTLTPPPHPQSGVQISGSATSPATTPKPLHPSSNDFTFQPNRPQNPATQMTLRPNFQSAHSVMPPRNLNMHPPQAHQISSFHPPVQNSAPPPVMQGFARPQVINHINQPQAHMSSPSAGNLNSPHGPPRHPAFPGAWPVSPPTLAPQMGMRNFSPGSQVMNASGAFPFRPGNIQQQHNYPIRSQGVFSPNQQFSGNLPFPPNRPSNSFGRQQNYDPFSPTSVPPRPQQSVNPSQARNEENDPEYEDLMASVGVK